MTDAAALLKSLRPTAGAALPVALGACVVRGLLVVAFAWTQSSIINDAALGGADLASLAGRVPLLIALTFAQALLGWVVDQAAFRASARVRQALFWVLVQTFGINATN